MLLPQILNFNVFTELYKGILYYSVNSPMMGPGSIGVMSGGIPSMQSMGMGPMSVPGIGKF